MKNYFKTVAVAVVMAITLIGCSKDEVYVQPELEEVQPHLYVKTNGISMTVYLSFLNEDGEHIAEDIAYTTNSTEMEEILLPPEDIGTIYMRVEYEGDTKENWLIYKFQPVRHYVDGSKEVEYAKEKLLLEKSYWIPLIVE